MVALNIDPAAVRPADVEVQHLAEVAQLVVRVAAALIVGQQDRRERDALAIDHGFGIGLLVAAVAGKRRFQLRAVGNVGRIGDNDDIAVPIHTELCLRAAQQRRDVAQADVVRLAAVAAGQRVGLERDVAAVELDGLAAHIGRAVRRNALLRHGAERTLMKALSFRGRKAVRARIQREIVDRDDVFLHRDARAVVVVHKRLGESEAVGHHHVLKQRVDLCIRVVGQLGGERLFDCGAAVGLGVLHRQRKPTVRCNGKRDRAGRGGLAHLGDLRGDLGKDRIELISVGKRLARLVAVVAVTVVAEVGKAVLGHLGAHIHRVDHFLGEAEFGLDRAAAVKLKRRIGDLAHAAAQKDGQHAHYQRRGEKLFHGISLLW